MGQQVRISQVDALTGEIMEGAALAVIFPKRKNGFQKGGWVAMSQGPLVELAKADLGDEARRVFMLLCGKLDFENWIKVSQAELARELGISRQNFGRGLAKLVAEGVVLVGPKVSGHSTFRLDPGYGWKGSAKGHHEALQGRIKAAGLSVLQGGK